MLTVISTTEFQEEFDKNTDSMTITFSEPGEEIIDMSIYSNSTYDYYTFSVHGAQYNGQFPSNISIDIGNDGSWEWNYGKVLGNLHQLDSGLDRYTYDFSDDIKHQNDQSISIPLDADISSASLTLSPKVTTTETMFIDIGQYRSMASTDEELWITAENGGLIKRDIISGYQQVFTNEDGLNNSDISSVAMDSDYVYIGSRTSGVSIYDREADDFSEYRWNSENDLESDVIRHLYSNDDKVFIVTDLAVQVFDKYGEFGSFTEKWDTGNGPDDELINLNIRDIETTATKIYFGSISGLSIYDRNTGLWDYLKVQNGLNSNNITDMVRDGDLLYIATDNGISCYDSINKEILWKSKSQELTGKIVKGLTINDQSLFALVVSTEYSGKDAICSLNKSNGKRNGNIWFSGNSILEGEIIYEINYHMDHLFITTPTGFFDMEFPFETLMKISTTNNQPPSNNIRDFLYDFNEEILYVSTDSGVGRYDPNQNRFLNPWNKIGGLPSDDVYELELIDDVIYIQTKSYGVARWNMEEKIWLEPLDRFSGLLSSSISSIKSHGHMLYISSNKGVDAYNTSSNRIQSSWDARNYFNTTTSDGLQINEISADSQRVFFALSPVYSNIGEMESDGGLWIYDKNEHDWQHFSNSSGVNMTNLSSSYLKSISHSGNHLFLGTDNGINIFDVETSEVTIIDKSTNNEFMGQEIRDLYYDDTEEPKLYISIGPIINNTDMSELGGGLIVMDPDTGSILDYFNITNTDSYMNTLDIQSIERVSDMLYLGSYVKGILRLDLTTLEFLDPTPTIGEKQYPQGVRLDLGDDGITETEINVFKKPVDIDITDDLNEILEFSSNIYQDNSGIENALIPINISLNPMSAGAIILSYINIKFNHYYSIPDISESINSYLENINQTNLTQGESIDRVPIRVKSDTSGKLVLSQPTIIFKFSNPPLINIISPLPKDLGTYYWDTVPITFDASGTYDPDGDSIEFLWTSDTDKSFTGSSEKFTYQLPSGNHQISLNVTDPTGRYTLRTWDVKVKKNIAPIAVISGSAVNGTQFYVKEEIHFSAGGSYDANPEQDLDYSWYAKKIDGGTSELFSIGNKKDFDHSFDLSGTYNITLEVNDGSLKDERKFDIEILSHGTTERELSLNLGTMNDVFLDYLIVHSTYEPSSVEITDLNLFEEELLINSIPPNQTHIGVGFSIIQNTNNTVYEETINISYSGQEEFLENIDENSIALYILKNENAEDERKRDEENYNWIKCPILDHNTEKDFIYSAIPLGFTDMSSKFMLLSNSSYGWTRGVKLSFVEPTDPLQADPVNTVITLRFDKPVLSSYFTGDKADTNVEIRDEKGSKVPISYTPNFDPIDQTLTMKVDEFEYDSDYTIILKQFMDQYRNIGNDYSLQLHTIEEDKPDEGNNWLLYAVIGGAVLLIGAVVLFIVIKRRAPDEDYEEDVVEYSCPRCGVVVLSEEKECPECGYELTEKEKGEDIIKAEFIDCPDCGKRIDEKSQICPFCSISLVEDTEEELEEELLSDEIIVDAEEADILSAQGSGGAPMDMPCPTCGDMVEMGTVECPSCGEDQFT